jgi:hypothetical protein
MRTLILCGMYCMYTTRLGITYVYTYMHIYRGVPRACKRVRCVCRLAARRAAGPQFTHFTGKKVHILTFFFSSQLAHTDGALDALVGVLTRVLQVTGLTSALVLQCKYCCAAVKTRAEVAAVSAVTRRALRLRTRTLVSVCPHTARYVSRAAGPDSDGGGGAGAGEFGGA